MEDISLTNGMIILVLVGVDALMTLGYAALANVDLDENKVDYTQSLKQEFALGGQVSLVLVRFIMAALAVDGIILPLTQANPSLPPVLFYVVVLLPLALFVLVFGEVVPSIVGETYANTLAPSMAGPMRMLSVALRPFTWLINLFSALVVRLIGVKHVSSRVTEQRFLKLIENEAALEANERKMIHSVMQLDATTVKEMMVPRIDVIAVEENTTIAEARDVFLASGHSRMPVYKDNIDHIVGVVYVKDLLEVWHNGDTVVGSVAEIMRNPYFVQENMTGDQLLRFFQKNKIHAVIVLEEYGGTGGLVTLEDLLEEIVGDIQDEYDGDEHDEIVQIDEYEYRIDAGISLYDLEDRLAISLEDEEVDTLGGYIFKMLDRVPEINEQIMTETVKITVLSLEGRRIREVRLKVLDNKPTSPPASDDLQPIESSDSPV